MKKMIFLTLLVITMASGIKASAEAVPGKPAPDFTATDATGARRSLADYKGKWLVLEWFNKDCPFVHKQYDSGNMQALQKTYTEKGVVWLSVVSSAKGKQGYVDGKEAIDVEKAKKAFATSVLLDPSGAMGHAYGAKTTPHMFVIDPKGIVVYEGAIDDNDSSDPSVIKSSKNYVAAALDSAMASKKVDVSSSRPYGCSVKY